MITSFADKETAKIASGEVSKKLPREIQEVALKKLRILAATVKIEDLWKFPSLNAEKLKGTKIENLWSIRINKQWRIRFKWDAERQQASEVGIVDYH